MAKPLTLAQVKAAFDKWGISYYVVPGCETRSNRTGWQSDKITGCMYHHTAMDASDAVNLRVIRDGHSSLSGPLANFGVRDNGMIDIVALGSANHAGGGDPETLALVAGEKTPLDREVKPDESSASSRAVNGNYRFYGWESYYGIGADPTPNGIQHRATILSMVAIIEALDARDGAPVWSGRAAIGHREWTKAKIDPSAVKMDEVRRSINTLRAAGPARAKVWLATGVLPPASTPAPTKPSTGGTPVAQVRRYVGTAVNQAIVKAFLGADAIINPADPKSATNGFWSLQSWYDYVGQWIHEILQTGRSHTAELDALRDDVAAIKALLEKQQTGGTP